MKRLHVILSIISIAIGVVHVVFTASLYEQLNFNALWFLSGGLFLIVVAFLNLIMNRRRSATSLENNLWVTTNFLMLIFIGMSLYVMWDIGTIIVSTLVAAMILTAFMIRK